MNFLLFQSTSNREIQLSPYCLQKYESMYYYLFDSSFSWNWKIIIVKKHCIVVWLILNKLRAVNIFLTQSIIALFNLFLMIRSSLILLFLCLVIIRKMNYVNFYSNLFKKIYFKNIWKKTRNVTLKSWFLNKKIIRA